MTTQTVALLQTEAPDPAVTRILDAAADLFEDVGIRRATIEDVARRAGVDRVTVYRRVGGKNDVAHAVLMRDVQRLFGRVAATMTDKDLLDDRVVAAFVGLMRGIRDHALFNRLVRLEPDETLPKVTVEASGMFTMGIVWAVEALLPPKAGARARADMTARVEIIGRFIHSSMLTQRGAVELVTDKQLIAFARRYIVPIVTA